MLSNILEAQKAWTNAIGAENVILEDSSLQRYRMNTIGHSTKSVAVLKPRSVSDVQKIVAVANQYKVPLYPISTGHNWGYGSANAPKDGCAIVDMSRMNTIVNMDPVLGTVTVEPGVTQQQLSSYLKENNLKFRVPVHGAGPNVSVLGNALERGFGITPHTDHFAALTALEVVLPNGEIYQSAHAALGAKKIDSTFKWGLGPYLDGLFSQSNLGIVTKATFRLAAARVPAQGILFNMKKGARMEDMIKALQTVLQKLPGIVVSFNFMNARRILSMSETYPKNRVKPGEVIPESIIRKMSLRLGNREWVGFAGIYGDKDILKVARATMKRELGPQTGITVHISRPLLKRFKVLISLIPKLKLAWFRKCLERRELALRLLEGEPVEIALPLAYWKKGGPPKNGKPLNPAEDGCGLIWYAPLVPMDPPLVHTFEEKATQVCIDHGIEPLITFTSLADGVFDCSMPLLFDKDDPDETDRAHKCWDALYELGKSMGIIPYRLPISAMHKVIDPSQPFWKLAAEIKKTIDPNGIIAPGRYDSETPNG